MGRLNRRLERVTKGLSEFVLKLERTIIDEVATEVVRSTPVDTGYARGNWVPGLNSPPITPTSSLDPTGQAAPGRISALARFLRLGDTFYITNNAAYIELLNRGYSPQAAAQFVSRAVSRGVELGISKVGELRVR